LASSCKRQPWTLRDVVCSETKGRTASPERSGEEASRAETPERKKET
jgi:hypothetical protein